MTGSSIYWAVDKETKTLIDAIHHIESNNYEMELREAVINLWEEIDAKFDENRKPKMRF